MARSHLSPGAADHGYGMSQERLVNLEGGGGKKSAGRKKIICIIIGVLLTCAVVGAIIVAVLASQGVIDTSGSSDGDSSPAAAGDSASESTSSPLTSQPTAATSGSAAAPTGTSTAASASSSSTRTRSTARPTSTACSTLDDIPRDARGSDLDVTEWYETDGFNCTFTDETVGGLPVVGLFSDWDDSARANPGVPALDEPWGSYAERPARGVNVGGWLSLEPFISPSLFDYDLDEGVVDEHSLCRKLGSRARERLEEHYATFITERDFERMAEAGIDHVRIPFSYWAVEVYDDDDPFLARVSWRYLLRGVEWARRYGIRVKLDVHGLPGSQNGWNHSGRQGSINWIEGPDGALNRQRSLDMHDKLSAFFAQPRYRNVVAFYGQANEPGHALSQADVEAWTDEAYDIIRGNGVRATQVFGEAFKGLGGWQGRLQGRGDGLAIDAHQYLIFNDGLLAQSHADKITFVCGALLEQSVASMDTGSGFGPTIIGEWSQADTDCARFLNGVGNGARWTGTFNGDGSSPGCPTADDRCDCSAPNADPADYSDDYKLFLRTFAEAQMDAYEKTWGWFYWTWKTEDAGGWSYLHGLDNGYMPEKAYDRSFDCSKPVPDFGDLPEYV